MTMYNNSLNCPLNEFCSKESLHECRNVTLALCKYCDLPPAYVLITMMALLGVLILFGNGLIVLVIVNRFRCGTTSKIDPVKLSLAVSDLLSGLQIFAAVLPTTFWEMSSTVSEILKSRTINTPLCGAIFILSFSSSLYHLILMGCQRIYAILYPQRFIRKSLKHVYVSLAIVWVLASLTAATPGVLSNYYRYCSRNHLCFVCSSSVLAHVMIYSIYLFFPFVIMIVSSIFAAIVIHRKLQLSQNLRNENIDANHDGKRAFHFSKQQKSMFKTIAIMQLGFTAALGPTVVVLLLVFIDILDCDYADAVETTCFVLYFTNSLVNVLVYSLREGKFRSDAINALHSLIPSCVVNYYLQQSLHATEESTERITNTKRCDKTN